MNRCADRSGGVIPTRQSKFEKSLTTLYKSLYDADTFIKVNMQFYNTYGYRFFSFIVFTVNGLCPVKMDHLRTTFAKVFLGPPRNPKIEFKLFANS